MAEPHPDLRETAVEIRESAPGAVHASRNAGVLAAVLRNDWVRTIAFSLAIAAFLSFVGAFGTTGVPVVQRTAIFCGYSLYGGLLNAWTRRQSRITERPGLRPFVIAAAMTVLMTLSVWTCLSIFEPSAPRRLVPLLVTCLVMSAVITATATAMFRPARFTHVAPSGPTTEPPRFLARLPAKLRGADLWAIQAEDHYLRLHTARGEDLILMRLADAIGELEGIEGARTHRSWWVARASVHEVIRSDGKIALALPNGVAAPVLRQAGWL